jgi:hypothetical protein
VHARALEMGGSSGEYNPLAKAGMASYIICTENGHSFFQRANLKEYSQHYLFAS